MSFKFNLIKANPSEAEGKQLLEQAENLLNELIEVGLQVRETTWDCDKTPVVYVSEMPTAPNNRGSSEEKVVLDIQGTVSSYDIANLVQSRDYYTFIRGLKEQEMRMAALGWTANIHGNREVAIIMSGSQSITLRDPQLNDLLWLEQEVTHAECRSKLYEHMKEFAEVGIRVAVQDICFKIVLRENDPELIRNLTPENVEEIIKIAGALAR